MKVALAIVTIVILLHNEYLWDIPGEVCVCISMSVCQYSIIVHWGVRDNVLISTALQALSACLPVIVRSAPNYASGIQVKHMLIIFFGKQANKLFKAREGINKKN